MISIVVLNWNGKEITEECLNSIKKQTFKDYEIILVDNNSTDGSSEYLKKRFPKINLIQNKENYGYAKGNNIGIKKAKGDYVLILNNDIILDKNFLKELDKHKNKADILGAKNYFYDKPKII
jgi:GT2 family glycosyltransferase